MSENAIAIIGGSGLYDLTGLTEVREIQSDTPFGPPSSPVVAGRLGATRVMFLARHGKGHRFTPSEVNYRANVFALKALGASQILSVSAVGSMREEIRPGDIVLPDQYIDRTKGRPSTFFGDGIVGHVAFADPTCDSLRTRLHAAAGRLGLTCHLGGTLMVMEGPAFSTRAESRMHRQLGVDLIGMTAMPEAKLAREAELCYATVALATDYDCWHESEDDVSVGAVLEVMRKNVASARDLIRAVASEPAGAERTCPCASALEHAVVTDRKVIPAETKQRMQPIFGRVL
jgi:5'-methylthioadenosine phosphorylase